MRICDRCEGRDDIRVVYIRVDFGPEPIRKDESQFWERELCRRCRKLIDAAITAALALDAEGTP
jgi:hypothetical protein